MENLNEKVFELFDSGVSAGKIAQKLKVKKSVVQDILGNANDKGLGDTIAAITEATGIKAAVEAVTDDCGCAARAETLNKMFPNRKLNDLSEGDFLWLSGFFATKRSSVNAEDQASLVRIYNSVFNAKRVVSSCGVCVAKMVDELNRIYLAAK